MSIFKGSDTAWLIGNEALPRADSSMAVGTYDSKIFLIGGSDNRQQLIEYDINSEQITDHGSDFLSSQSYGNIGQFWTQQGNIVYIINANPSYFDTFDMVTKQYINKWRGITFNSQVGSSSCLASAQTFLYVVGGVTNGNTINTVQILSLSTYSWMSNPPFMKDNREYHACVVHNGYLWAFGGSNRETGAVIWTNERVQITNIAQKTWDYIDSFRFGIEYIGAVAFGDIIYIPGGSDTNRQFNFDNPNDWVHLIDANTGTITQSPDNMPWTNQKGSPIIVDGIFYVFGGQYYEGSVGGFLAEWIYSVLPTSDPTAAPSRNPSRASEEPSQVPTENPTVATTNDPIVATTNDPTAAPSHHPSTYPTKRPTSASTSYGNTTTFTESITTDKKAQESGNKTQLVFIVLLCSGSFCVCCILLNFIWFWRIKLRKNEMEQQQENSKTEPNIEIAPHPLPDALPFTQEGPIDEVNAVHMRNGDGIVNDDDMLTEVNKITLGECDHDDDDILEAANKTISGDPGMNIDALEVRSDSFIKTRRQRDDDNDTVRIMKQVQKDQESILLDQEEESESIDGQITIEGDEQQLNDTIIDEEDVYTRGALDV